MTGRDVAIACMLGAEEFGFATAPLVAMGCVMMRVCNLDTCPVGIATQNPKLRLRFAGKPEYVMNFMLFVAEELREFMAGLGIKKVDDLVGRADLLKVSPHMITARAASLDLSEILYRKNLAQTGFDSHIGFDPEKAYDFQLKETLDEKVILPAMTQALEKKEGKTVSVKISSVNRTLGTIFGSEVTRRYQNTLPDDTYQIHCTAAEGSLWAHLFLKALLFA